MIRTESTGDDGTAAFKIGRRVSVKTNGPKTKKAHVSRCLFPRRSSISAERSGNANRLFPTEVHSHLKFSAKSPSQLLHCKSARSITVRRALEPFEIKAAYALLNSKWSLASLLDDNNIESGHCIFIVLRRNHSPDQFFGSSFRSFNIT